MEIFDNGEVIFDPGTFKGEPDTDIKNFIQTGVSEFRDRWNHHIICADQILRGSALDAATRSMGGVFIDLGKNHHGLHSIAGFTGLSVEEGNYPHRIWGRINDLTLVGSGLKKADFSITMVSKFEMRIEDFPFIVRPGIYSDLTLLVHNYSQIVVVSSPTNKQRQSVNGIVNIFDSIGEIFSRTGAHIPQVFEAGSWDEVYSTIARQ